MNNKSMFDDVEEVRKDSLGQTIKAKVFETFGLYPVLDISENWTLDYDEDREPVVLRDFHILLDTELVDKIEDWDLSYVQFLFERLITDRLKNPSHNSTDTSSSKKYCFSDTPDWWVAAKLDHIPEGRQVYTLRVELG